MPAHQNCCEFNVECHNCLNDEAPSQWQAVLANFFDAGPGYPDINGTYVLDNVGACIWRFDPDFPDDWCFDRLELTLYLSGGDTWLWFDLIDFAETDFARFQKNLGVEPDCLAVADELLDLSGCGPIVCCDADNSTVTITAL